MNLLEYSTRRFTKDRDVIRASLAALHLFSHIYDSTLLWGLPELILDRALLWNHHKNSGYPGEETSFHLGLGRLGQLQYNYLCFKLSYFQVHRLMVWYKLSVDGDLITRSQKQ
jgi:hypothetical protein